MLWVDTDYDISKTIPVLLPGGMNTPVFQKNSHLCERFYLGTADNVWGSMSAASPKNLQKCGVLREEQIQHQAKQRPKARPGRPQKQLLALGPLRTEMKAAAHLSQ